MAFTETVLQICDSITEDQATQLREFLVEACQQIQADPELMALGLQGLKKEVTDQGYEWENLAGTMLQLTEPSLTIESARQLKAAWNDSMASNASIADFAAMMNRDFPIVNDFFRNLANEAAEDHNALSCLAGGTHIGQGIATASSKTGKALASPWNKNSKLNKKQRIAGEAVEIGLVAAAGYYGGKAIKTAIYEAGDKKQWWGTIDKNIGAGKIAPERAPTFRQWISKDLFYPLNHPQMPGVARDFDHSITADPKQVLKELTAARDKLHEAGTLTKEQEDYLFKNAYRALGNLGPEGGLRTDVVATLHPDPEIRERAQFLGRLKANFTLPDSLRAPLREAEAAFQANNIAVDRLDNAKIAKIYEQAVRNPIREQDIPPNDIEEAMDFYAAERINFQMEHWDPPGGVKEQSENQCFRDFCQGLNITETKLMISNHAIRNGVSFDEAVKFYTSPPNNDVYQTQEEIDFHHFVASNAGKGLDRNGGPLSNSEKKLNEASNLISYREGFSEITPPNFEEVKKQTWDNYNAALRNKEAEIAGKTNPEQGPSRDWADELVDKGEVKGIEERLSGVNPRRVERVVSEDVSDLNSSIDISDLGGDTDSRGSVSGFINDMAGGDPDISVQEFSGVLPESSYRAFSGIGDLAENEVDDAVNEAKDAADNLVNDEVDAAGNLVDNAESDLI